MLFLILPTIALALNMTETTRLSLEELPPGNQPVEDEDDDEDEVL